MGKKTRRNAVLLVMTIILSLTAVLGFTGCALTQTSDETEEQIEVKEFGLPWNENWD